jgi:alpha-mannosidase
MTAENLNLNENEEHWATSTASSSLIYSWVMNNSWHTNYKASQEGITAFKYALLPHSKFDYSKAYRFGVEQSQPLIVAIADGKQGKSLFSLDDTTKIVVSSIKTSQDGKSLIIKFYNPTNEYSSSKVNFDGKARHKLYFSNGKEENISKINGRIELKPFAVKIIKLENN